jgi:hypothetical protein
MAALKNLVAAGSRRCDTALHALDLREHQGAAPKGWDLR